MVKKSKKKRTGTALAAFVWILGFLVIAGAFFIKREDILTTLKTTGFFQKIGVKEPEIVSKHEARDNPPRAPEPAPGKAPLPAQAPPAEAPGPEPAPVKVAPVPGEAAPQAQDSAFQGIKLWFVAVEGDGGIIRKEVSRQVPRTGAPLTAAIQALLAGPTAADREKGCITLIPEGARLLSASVNGTVATLNFSDEFQYNKYGVEGASGSLMQVVYTAVQFSTVDSVQFLIEGERIEYIGSEGVWIGSPRTAESFRQNF
ncbi:MAG: GerMN domain-containing protein [Spirochaetaceae bacterium]|nr:GerMN domain-containing protein [Spirochaetaceae bacterium]